MSRKKKPWRLEVRWADTVLLREGWQNIDDVLRRRDAVRCLSVGFVLADDDQGVVLAASVHGNEAAGITMIPKQAVTRRRRLA